jgi:hypothetical protein
MCELVQSRERRADCAEDTASCARNGAVMSDKRSWAPIFSLIALLGLSTLGVLAAYDVNQRNRPSDEELTANFFSYETRFNELVRMLDTDRRTLATRGATTVDLAAMAKLGTNAARVDMYRRLLQQISVADLRYFPDSGKIILLPDGQENLERPSKSYLYLRHAQPQHVVQHHGYNWRGPGVCILTGDRPLKESWFIHYDTMIGVAFSPY